MAEQKQGGSSSEMTAGPNVNELVWALNASAAVEDAEASGEPQGDLEDDSEAEEAGASSSQQPESGGSAVTSSKKKKKKSGKTKAALSKLKDKLHKDPSAASDSAPSEEQVEALQSQIKSRVAAEHGQDLADQMTPDVVAQILQQAKLQDLRANGPDGSPLSSHVKKDIGSHKFWSTQPVNKDPQQSVEAEGPIEQDKTPDQIRQEPLPLSAGFEWCTVDLNNEEQLQEVYSLLTHHYVEDLDASFRFDYSGDFIKWALQPPGYVQDWHIGVRVTSSKKLVAFISGVPVNLRVRDITKRCSEINFLCVHKKLRSKRLTPVLIQEVTRRCHQKGVFQAIYTAGIYLPTPVARTQYFHRQLNTKKLVDLGFAGVPRHKSLAGVIRENAVSSETKLPGLREMEERDVKSVTSLLRAYLSRFEMAPIFDEHEVRHNFLFGKGSGQSVQGRRSGQVTWAYVVEDPTTNEITDFFSLYHLPSTAIKKAQVVDAAYVFYYATNAAGALSKQPTTSSDLPAASWSSESPAERVQLKKRLTTLMSDALVTANNAKFDVLNCVTCLDNSLYIHELKFGPGDGNLHYYLYNWLAKPIAGGTLAANQEASSHGGADPPPVGPAPPGLNVRECGSGVGVVML